MNLPNKLTIARVIFIPFFVLSLMVYGGQLYMFRMIALGLFCLASFTDFLDGYIARKQNIVTNFGKFMDPLADKLLVSSALICFIELNQISAWIVIIIISREFIISGFRLVASDKGIVIAASYWGKFKTLSQMIAVILMIINNHKLIYITDIFIIVMILLTIISLVDYLAKNYKVLTERG